MKIHVTRYDIENGSKCCPFSCPVARAVCRAYKKRVPRRLGYTTKRCLIAVLCNVIRLDTEYYIVPKSVGQFIMRFDADQPVEPFSFEADLPETLDAA